MHEKNPSINWLNVWHFRSNVVYAWYLFVFKVPLARSEIHLTEVFETICEKFRQYGNTKNELGKKSVVRMVSRDGRPLVLKDIHITMEGMKLLTHTVCIDSKYDLKS